MHLISISSSNCRVHTEKKRNKIKQLNSFWNIEIKRNVCVFWRYFTAKIKQQQKNQQIIWTTLTHNWHLYCILNDQPIQDGILIWIGARSTMEIYFSQIMLMDIDTASKISITCTKQNNQNKTCQTSIGTIVDFQQSLEQFFINLFSLWTFHFVRPILFCALFNSERCKSG